MERLACFLKVPQWRLVWSWTQSADCQHREMPLPLPQEAHLNAFAVPCAKKTKHCKNFSCLNISFLDKVWSLWLLWKCGSMEMQLNPLPAVKCRLFWSPNTNGKMQSNLSNGYQMKSKEKKTFPSQWTAMLWRVNLNINLLIYERQIDFSCFLELTFTSVLSACVWLNDFWVE